MNEWFKIGAFVLLLFLLTAEDCSNRVSEPSQENQSSQLFLDLENKFEKEQLQPEELVAFEKRSIQMLADLIDYINIYADSGISKEFRLQTRQMIAEFFLNDSEVDSLFTTLNLVEDKKRNILLSNEGKPFQLKLDSCSLSENLSPQSNQIYLGRIEFNLSSNSSVLNSPGNAINVKLLKSPKQFGTDSMDVWGIFFGYINSN